MAQLKTKISEVPRISDRVTLNIQKLIGWMERLLLLKAEES